MSRNEIYTRIARNSEIDLTTGCWIWQGANSGTGRGGGYPRMSLYGSTVAVHRVMFINENGFVPNNKQIDHLCENRMCVNPLHMEMVTQAENQRRKHPTIRSKNKPKGGQSVD